MDGGFGTLRGLDETLLEQSDLVGLNLTLAVVHTLLPGFGATNLAFGGAGERTLYLTASLTGAQMGEASGKLIAIKWPRPGLKLL